MPGTDKALPLPTTIAPTERLLDLRQVRQIVPKSTTTIYRWMRSGAFPPNYQIGPASVVWLQSDITKWLNERIRPRE